MASRIGTVENLPKRENEGRRRETPSVPKRRVKFTNIPLDVSDYTLEDMVKEYGATIYSNFYDSKEDRTAVFEFEDESVLDKIVEKYNDTELHGSRLHVEIFDLNDRKSRRRDRRVNQRSSRGSHYGVRKDHGAPRQRVKPPTAQDLDAELEEYMNS